MAQDFSDLATTEAYAALLTRIGDRDVALALGFDPATTNPSNVKTNTLRWNSANGYWEKYNGATWGALAGTYNITAARANHLSGGAGGQLLYQSATDVTAKLAAGTNGYVLTMASSVPAWVAQSMLIAGGAPWSGISGKPTTLSGYGITDAAPLASPALTGAPTAPTAAEGTATTAIATTEFVDRLRDVIAVQKSGSYTLALTDRGKSVDTSAGVTVPANATVGFQISATVTITNTSASSITITQASGVTLRQAGTTNTGNRTLANYGVATLRKIATDTWIISGAGLS